MPTPSDQLVIDQLPALLRYARALARSEQDAEDLVHDTLTAAYARRGQLRAGAPLAPWLLGILRHRFIDGWRSARRDERARDDLARLSPAGAPPQQEQAFRLAELERALAALPDDQREALHLVAVEGLSYQSAAEILEVPIGTLMSRISRARLRLRSAEDGRERGRTHLRVVKEQNRP
jgi:RNA polymerase sigma-70 factor (ECF subfamily)